MMVGNLKETRGIMSWIGSRKAKRKIVVGLKCDNSKEMLLQVLSLIAEPGDSVLAVHVQESDDDSFNPNTFHVHEDLCLLKKVDFEVKICAGSCFVTELSHLVRITFAKILAVGPPIGLKNSTTAKFLKALPPTCNLLIIDDGGKILFERAGTSQQGTNTRFLLYSSSSSSGSSRCNMTGNEPSFRKSLSVSSSSTSQQTEITEIVCLENDQDLNVSLKTVFQRLNISEVKGNIKHFRYEELNKATKKFSQDMLIGEGGNSLVYQAILENGELLAVKVLKSSQYSEEFFFNEVEILSGLRHENIVQLIGYSHCQEIHAIVYNLMNSSLKQKLEKLKWNERMRIAVDVAKALEYLHCCDPPVVHRDVKSSNILLCDDGKPQLSDFGSALVVENQTHQSSEHKKRINVVGTLGYMAPEYMINGKVDQKIDVYSYGVVLLELITGKEAIQTNLTSTQESLVSWARSLLSKGLFTCIIDPGLDEDYNKDEMSIMIIAARLCLSPSSSRRPNMKTVLSLLEERKYWTGMQKIWEDLLTVSGC